MTTRHAGQEGFRWFVATVESLSDPMKAGRVGIRTIPDHDDTASIQPKDLLWGMPIVPPTAPSAKGFGSMHQLELGTYVIGFYADGEEAQIPLIMGTWTGSGDLPPEVTGTTTAKKLPIGLEKPIAFGAKYPYNKVTKTKGGHLFEMDDTPGSERLHLYHTKGSYIEWDFMGNRIDGTILNSHDSVGGIRNDFTKLIHNITALGAMNMITAGAYTVAAGGSASLNAGGTVGITSGLASSVTAGGLANITGGAGVNIKSPLTITSAAPTITSAGATVTSTGAKNKTQKFQLVENALNVILFDDNIGMLMDPTGVHLTATPTTKLDLLKAGGVAVLSGVDTTVSGTTQALLMSPAVTITGGTSTIINGGGANILTMNSGGATWTTNTLQVTASTQVNLYPAVKFDVRSAAVSLWSSAATALESGTTFSILSGTTLSMVATDIATLTSPGAVNIGTGAGGISTSTSVGGGTIVVGGAGTTTTVTISATGSVSITSPSGAVEITAPAINMNGAVAVVGSLTLGGLPVKT